MIAEVKNKAEKCMTEEKYTEAFFHWTKAIHISEQNGQNNLVEMFAQRAKCFLQAEQFFYAMEDAKKVLELEPNSALGHLRLAEVYFETGNYMDALPVIGKCFTLTNSKDEKDHLLGKYVLNFHKLV